jgi:WD40 repeat protein
MTVPVEKRVTSPRPMKSVPLDSSADPDMEVVSITVYGESPLMLAVGHKDGTIHSYNVADGKWLMAFKTQQGLSQLLSLRRYGYLAALHEGKNILQLWSVSEDKSVILDFNAELDSVNKRLSTMAAAIWDEARSGTFV